MELNELKQHIANLIKELEHTLNNTLLAQANMLFKEGKCQALSRSDKLFDFCVEGYNNTVSIHIHSEEIYDNGLDDDVEPETTLSISTPDEDWDRYSFACLLQMQADITLEYDNTGHKQYTRKGMVQRVLDERMHKAIHAEYRIKWANNIYGDHILTNENGVQYKIFLRNFENETGYSNSKDSAVNKLGTTKHIMFAFNQLKSNASLYKKLNKQCPFIEVYCDPQNDYAIRYFYPHPLPNDEKGLITKYFNHNGFVEKEKLQAFTNFFNEAQFYNSIVIRPEVKEKVSNYLESKALEKLAEKFKPDFNAINAKLYNYQQEGVRFAVCRKHAIIADEMGLGKTLQAITIAVLKKDLFGFKKTLVVCPASLKEQWKREIEKFTSEKALVVNGLPEERAELYQKAEEYFLIVNYETVLRDQMALNRAKIDFLILDEAQRVKNYATKTASAIKNVGRKHVLIITGTPIENKLIDLFSLMTILDPHLLGPLWEFSYKHCLFDNYKPNKINAYYNLNSLKEALKPVLLRREKRKVLEQLPNVQQQDVPVGMTPLQADFHASYAAGIGQIVSKKFLTAFDMQRLQQLLTAMRMVCNSTYLVDEATNESPKLDELQYILIDKLDLKNQDRKVIIFSEWVKTHKLIGEMLLKNGIGYTELNGNVPVKQRGALIEKFETDNNCKVFLSTEAGGAGLNLQVADILINFELPWNPAKKNQRIGRIDRLGQKSEKLTIFNLITLDSIEQRIALGLLVKQNLFDNVLNEEANNDFVDFTEKGRGQFLEQMKELAGSFDETSGEEISEGDEPETPEETLIEEQNETVETAMEDETADSMPTEKPTNINNETPTDKPGATEPEIVDKPATTQVADTAKQMEEVMNNGMQFLSGLMQMATGKSISTQGQHIEVNKETGEVTMKFKIPV